MSKSIDEKVVSLRFDNKQFDKGVDSTLKRVDDLNKGLKLEGASKGLEKVADKADKVDLSKMEVSIDRVQSKITTLSVIAATFVERITNQLIDFGKRTMDTFAIEPVTTGFNEYELKMGSVQTIMASTGASIQEVNGYLNELNKYSDKTIYSFSDMTNNIGKFTNAGVGLNDAVSAIKGISNEAAVSGANAQEASRAMYNFAQALSAGSVKLIDWKSIENANMATVEFKNELLKTAEEIGTVTKDAAGMYQVLTTNASGAKMKEAIDATHNFNESLSHQWMTSEVLIETLKRYGNEETEIGKKAFAAAQDVKTFSMMVDTLKEAAQSGWAETWEYIAGDFEQAKSLWTDMTETFSKIIEGSAEARNELIGNAMKLADDKGVTGRMALWEGIKNLLDSLISTLGAVKKGFEDIFPPITDQKLRSLIESFKNWTEILKNDEERLDKIRRTFRGIFAVIDIFVMVIRKAFQVSTAVIKAFVSFGVNAFMTIAGWFIMWGEKIDTATSGFNGWLRNIRDGVRDFIAYLDQLEGGFTLENLFKTFDAFGKNVLGAIFNFDFIKQGFDSFLNKFLGLFKGLESNTEGSSGKVMKIVSNMIQFLMTAKDKLLDILVSITGSVTPEQVLAIGIGLALLLLIGAFSKFASSLTNLADSITGVFERVDKTMKNFGTKMKSEAVWNFAKSIAVVVASLALLTGLDQDALTRSTLILAGIAAGITVMSIAMSKLSGNAKQTLTFSALIVGLSASIKILAQTLSILDEIKFENGLKQPLTLLASLAAGLVVVGKLLGSKSKVYAMSAASMLGFALALKVLVDAFEDLTKRNLIGTKGALTTLAGLLGVVGLLGSRLGKVNVGTPLTILALVAGLKLVLTSFETLSGFDEQTINSSLNSIIKIFGTFALLVAAMSLANIRITSVEEITEDSKKKSTKSADSIKQVGNAILKMSAALLIVGAAIGVFSRFSDEDLKKAEKIILELFGVFAALTAISALAGGNADKAGTMISRMTGSVLAISALVAVLTLFDDPNVLKAPLRLIEELLIVMGAVVALGGLTGADKDVGKTVTMITAGVVALSIMIAVMSGLDQNGVKNAALAISAVTVAFGLLVASTGLAKKANVTVVVMSAVVAALALVVTKMDKLQNGLQSAGALGILAASLAASMAILSKAGKFNASLILGIVTMATAIGVLGGVLSGLHVEISIQTAGSLGVLFLTLASSLKILDEADGLSRNAVISIGVMSVIFTSLGLLVSWLANPDTDILSAISNATMIGVLAISLSTAMVILSKSEAIDSGIIGNITLLGLAVTAIGGVIGLLEKYNLTPSIQNVGTLSVLLYSLIGAFKLLQGTNAVDSSILGQIALLGLVVGELQLVVGGLQKFGGINVSIENAVSLSVLILALSKAAQWCANAGALGFQAGIAGVGVVAVFVVAMGTLMAIIGALVSKFPTINDVIDSAITTFEKIGEGLGAAIVGVGNGILKNFDGDALVSIGESIADFIETVAGAIDGLSGIPEGAFANASALARVMLTLSAADLLDGVANWLNLGSNDNLDSFEDDATNLASGVVAFANKASEITDTNGVNNAVAVLEKLVEVSNKIPLTGGILQQYLGERDASKFAEGMEDLIKGIKKFNDGTKGFTKSDGFETAIEVMKKLASAAQEIPNSGGYLADWIGDNEMGDWAGEMPDLAAGLVSFTTGLKGFDTSAPCEAAIEVMKKIALAAKEIPNSGGYLADWIGDNEMGDWAGEMKDLGLGLYQFCANVTGLTTTYVDDAIVVMKELYNFCIQAPVAYTNAANMETFGNMIASLGMNLYVYSTYIDNISNFDNFSKSASVISDLADMANTIGKTKLGNLTKFGEELVKFAEGSLVDFENVFKEAKLAPTGAKLGSDLVNAIKNKKDDFTIAARLCANNLLGGFEEKRDDLRIKGESLATSFINGFNAKVAASETSIMASTNTVTRNMSGGLEKVVPVVSKSATKTSKAMTQPIEEGLSKSSKIVDNYAKIQEAKANGTAKTVSKTIDANAKRVSKSTTQAAAAISKPLEDRLNSKWGENVTSSMVNGMTKGITSKSPDLVQSATNLWDSAGSAISAGKDKFQQYVQNKGIWDFGAGAGDNLTNARDWVKEQLGFGDGGLTDLFGFNADDIASQFEDSMSGIPDGIASGINGAAASIGSSGSVSAATENLSEKLALAMHEHFDYEPYIHLGEQMGEKMIIGAKGEIVEESEEITEAMAKVAEMAAQGIDEWKAWSEARQAYDKISDAELLAGWKVVQEKYKEGTKERMEADKQVYALQKSLVSSTYEFIKKNIETEKYYNRLTLEEELAIWEQATKMYKEESDQRIEIEKEVYRIKQELREKDYQNAVKNVERMAALNQLDVQGQIKQYTTIMSTYSDLSSHKEELEDKIYDLEQSRYAEAKKQISHLKKMDQLSKADELKAYQAMYSLVKKGSDDWLELEEEIYSLQKEINKAQEDHAKEVADAEEAAQQKRLQAEKDYADNVRKVEEQLARDIEDLNKQYEDAVNARAKELYGAWGIFDAVKDSDYDGTVFLENIEYQVETFEDWQKEINRLIARGVDESLIEELRDMGPQAVEQMRALNRLTDEQLNKYQDLWRQKTELARKQAISELEKMKLDTQVKIDELRAAAAKELEGYRQTWQDTMSQIESDLKTSLDSIKSSFAELTTSINSSFNGIQIAAEQTTTKMTNEAAKWGLLVKQADGTMRPANANDFKPGGVYSQADLYANTMRDLGASSGGSSKLSNAGTRLANTVSNALGPVGTVVGTALGSAISTGLSKSISSSSSTSSATKAGQSLARAVSSSISSALKIRSPSRVMMEYGKYATQGFVQGLLLYVPQAFDAGNRIGDSLSNGVASAGVYLQELLDDELDLDPHITPVLELEDLQNGFDDFNEFLDRSPVQIFGDATRSIDEQNNYKTQSRNVYLENILGEIREELGTLGSRIDGMQMVMDTGAVVGQIVSPLDGQMGDMVGRASRERM